jgi:hypothetical protein
MKGVVDGDCRKLARRCGHSMRTPDSFSRTELLITWIGPNLNGKGASRGGNAARALNPPPNRASPSAGRLHFDAVLNYALLRFAKSRIPGQEVTKKG